MPATQSLQVMERHGVNMKRWKKKSILLGCIVVIAIFLLGYVNEPSKEVEKEWNLTESLSGIQIIGLSQDINITIRNSEDGENKVLLKGEMPESYVKKIEQLVPSDDNLILDFKNEIGLSVAKTTKQAISVTIYLANQNMFEELIVKSNRGNVNISIPEYFEMRYQLLTNSGEVISPPEQADSSKLLKVDLGFGDIIVTKE